MVTVLSIIAALILLICFCQLFYVKLSYPYQGSHSSNQHLVPAPADYHPEPHKARYLALWQARMYQEADFLTVDIGQLNAVREVNLQKELSNWNWARVPTTEWPMVWRNSEVVAPAEC
jgi:hypothetical protein